MQKVTGTKLQRRGTYTRMLANWRELGWFKNQGGRDTTNGSYRTKWMGPPIPGHALEP